MVGCLVVSSCGGGSDDAPEVAPDTTAVAQATPASAPTTPAPDTAAEVTAAPSPADTVGPISDRFDPTVWTVGTEPVITHGPRSGWDGRYTDPGAVIVHDDVVYVFRNGFRGWPAPVGVALSTSSDGVTFSDSPDPLFDFSDLDYVGVAALASSVLVDSDGTWVMYFYSWDDFTWPKAPSVIGRATAPAATGPWTADPAPVLLPGAPGSWDDLAVRSPSVVVDESGTWHMWFAGAGSVSAAIGHAVSSDGISWSKDADPVMVGEPDQWDQPFVHQPRVTVGPDGFVMAYAGVSTVTDSSAVVQEHGVAVSTDGVTWRRSTAPALTASDAGGANIWWTALTWGADRYWWFLEVGVGGETNIHLATNDGPLGL